MIFFITDLRLFVCVGRVENLLNKCFLRGEHLIHQLPLLIIRDQQQTRISI
jgi:hypothetical protein